MPAPVLMIQGTTSWAGKSLVTFKGPPQASPMKLREEHETVVSDGDVLKKVFAELGFQPWFRYQKYREEFALKSLTLNGTLETAEFAVPEGKTLGARPTDPYAAPTSDMMGIKAAPFKFAIAAGDTVTLESMLAGKKALLIHVWAYT